MMKLTNWQKQHPEKEQLPPDVFFEEITEPSVKPKKEKQVSVISAEDWRTPIMEYLRRNIELQNEKEEKKMFQRARGYIISEGELFKSGRRHQPIVKVHLDNQRNRTPQGNSLRVL